MVESESESDSEPMVESESDQEPVVESESDLEPIQQLEEETPQPVKSVQFGVSQRDTMKNDSVSQAR